MSYIEYFQEKHYLALLFTLLSVILVFIEGKYNKQKYDFKYYLKIAILVFLNVYIVLYLI